MGFGGLCVGGLRIGEVWWFASWCDFGDLRVARFFCGLRFGGVWWFASWWDFGGLRVGGFFFGFRIWWVLQVYELGFGDLLICGLCWFTGWSVLVLYGSVWFFMVYELVVFGDLGKGGFLVGYGWLFLV